MRLTAFILAASFVAHGLALGQAGAGGAAEGARAALTRFVELSNGQSLRSDEARRLRAGEAARWDIPSFGKLAAAPDKVVALDAERAVGRVQWFGENEYVADLYFYLRREGGSWKVEAVRRLSLTGIVEDLHRALKAKKNRTLDEEQTLGNVTLVLASDAALREWFRRNRAALDGLAQSARAKAAGRPLHAGERDEQFPELAQALRRLHLSGVNVAAGGDVEVVIGGMSDNTVGFLHSPAKRPPPVSPSSHIWVEEVADGWYLFRTT